MTNSPWQPIETSATTRAVMTVKFATKAEFLRWVDSHAVLHYSLHGLLSEYEVQNTANPEKIRELCDRLNFTEFEEYPLYWAAKSRDIYLMAKKLPRVDPSRTINYRQDGIDHSKQPSLIAICRQVLGKLRSNLRRNPSRPE